LNPDDDPEELAPKSTHELPPGSVVSVRTPGGGGYGDSSDRDAGALARDLRLGKITPERLRSVYGIDPMDLRGDGEGER